MKIRTVLIIIILFYLSRSGVNSQTPVIQTGAQATELYFPLLKNKRIGITANHTSKINESHLVDTLIKSGFHVIRIFCPEHGFRGSEEAGQKIKNQKDMATGLPLISLYGKHKKPEPSEMKDLDLMIFDLQDVGVRCYTYLSTLHYVMESCAENHIPLLVLDRPNPNGFYIDGPVLVPKYKSFVGLHPVPFVYGMSIGEYAKMINGEKWLAHKIQCDLTIIACKNYAHDSLYQLPVKPSPNLPNMRSVYLYPSLTLFEGTVINLGRKTAFPFQVFGHPQLQNADFEYTIVNKEEKVIYHGVDLRKPSIENILKDRFTLKYLMFAYQNVPEKTDFFNLFFYNLSGTAELKRQIQQGCSEDEIRKSWQKDLEAFKLIRQKYLLYR